MKDLMKIKHISISGAGWNLFYYLGLMKKMKENYPHISKQYFAGSLFMVYDVDINKLYKFILHYKNKHLIHNLRKDIYYNFLHNKIKNNPYKLKRVYINVTKITKYGIQPHIRLTTIHNLLWGQ